VADEQGAVEAPIRPNSKFGVRKREAYLQLLREGSRRHAAARSIGVAPSTVSRFAREHADFALAIEEAEMEANQIVEDALFQAAASGNVIACQVWLYNRDPDRWMDMRRIGVNAQVTGEVEHRHSIDTAHLDDEIERALDRLLGEARTNMVAKGEMAPLGPDQRRPALEAAANVVDSVVIDGSLVEG